MRGDGCLSKSKDSRFWRGQFWVKGPDGRARKVFRSTGTEDKREARRILEVWMDAAQGKVSGEQARRVLADLLGGEGRRVSVRAFSLEWLESRRKEVKGGTFEFYQKAVKGWISGLGDKADRPVDELTPAAVVAWRDAASRAVSVTTVNHHLTCVRMILKEAVVRGWLRQNPAASVRRVKVSEEAVDAGAAGAAGRRPFTREELERVLAVASPEWRGMVLVGLYSGQRLGDLARLEWKDFSEGAVFFARTQKTGAAVWVPLPSRAVAAVEGCRKEPGQRWLFPGIYADLMGVGKGKANVLSRQFAVVLEQAGLREPEVWVNRKVLAARKAKELQETGVVNRRRVGKELVFHSLRHNTRTWLEESGAPVAVIDALMGQDARTGRRYTHVGKEAVRKAAEGMAERMKDEG